MAEKKIYYRIPFVTISPLSVGSGENNITDSDIMLDSANEPYIPGSALAGVYRSCLDKAVGDRYFGKIESSEDGQKAKESKVIVYDATVDNASQKRGERFFITKRDMVALDECKVAKPGAKFDFQIVEPGVRFVTYIELNLAAGDDAAEACRAADSIIDNMVSGTLAFGAKTTRGYGHIRAAKEEICRAEFELSSGSAEREKNDLEDWLDFDVYDETASAWKNWQSTSADRAAKASDGICIKLELEQKGGISIRQYSTVPGGPDYTQMKLNNGTPVIPGTTWAGAFRSQMKKLGMKETELEELFGKVNGDQGVKSHISFTETQIAGGTDIIYSRNAIDRFTGGTIDGALYTESTHYNGKTELVILVNFEKEPSGEDRALTEKFKKTLAAAITDLQEGYMAVGGLTAVGRGLFQVNRITVNENEIDLNDKDGKYPDAGTVYKAIVDQMPGMEG